MASKNRMQICHRSRLFRECLASALAEDERTEVVVTSDPMPEALAERCQDGLDLLLVDAGLPDTTAFRLVQMIRATGRGIRIILMVPSAAPDLIELCLRAGADGCVLDDDTLGDLRLAIEIVLSGRSYCSPQVAHRLFTRTDGIAQSCNGEVGGRASDLTMREDEILRMIAYRNLSNKQIARELRISIYTVKNHVHSIIEKLGVENRQTAVRQAVRRGLLSESIG